jgi:hypothetical protein
MLEGATSLGVAHRVISHWPGPLDGSGGRECEMSKVASFHRPQMVQLLKGELWQYLFIER